jgi:RNA 2',3'-cyclic 3'-phosphodiesterase
VAKRSRSSEPPSRGRLGSPRARLFVALDLPIEVRDALAAWRDEALAARDDLRAVAPESLHVTLAFLGYRPEKEIEETGRVVAAAVDGRPACRVRAREVAGVPPRRPRLFALDLKDEDGHVAQVQQAVSDALERARFYKPEKRPFWPHVTLARVKRNLRAAPLAAEPPPIEPFEAADVVLYRSTLRPQGALYERLSSARLGPS